MQMLLQRWTAWYNDAINIPSCSVTKTTHSFRSVGISKLGHCCSQCVFNHCDVRAFVSKEKPQVITLFSSNAGLQRVERR